MTPIYITIYITNLSNTTRLYILYIILYILVYTSNLKLSLYVYY